MGKYDDILAGFSATPASAPPARAPASAPSAGKYDDIVSHFAPGKTADANTPPAASSGHGYDWKDAAIDTVGNIASPVPIPFQALRYIAKDPVGAYKKNIPYLPAEGAVVGSLIEPAGGGAVGAGAGTLLKQASKVALEGKQYTPAEAGGEAALQTALGGLPETEEFQSAVTPIIQGFARRALGFGKGVLKRIGIGKGNEVAQTMLDQGVIKPFSGSDATLERATDLADESGKAMGEGLDAMDQTGMRSANPKDLARNVYDTLRPKYAGGAYDAQEKIAQEIHNTILAHGDGPASFNSIQDLKQTLQDLGKFNQNTDALKADMYRRASYLVKNAHDASIDTAVTAFNRPVQETALALPKDTQALVPDEMGIRPPDAPPVQQIAPDTMKRFQDVRRTAHHAELAASALRGTSAAEASNNIVSLPGVAIGAAKAAGGDYMGALKDLGFYEFFKRYGNSGMASIMNQINQSPMREALLPQFASFMKDQIGRGNGKQK